jgi:hypothetical protein
MPIDDILKPKSDNEIYKGLLEREPNLKNLFIMFDIQKGNLLNKLIIDSKVDEAKRNLWKQLISDHKKYINDTFKDF